MILHCLVLLLLPLFMSLSFMKCLTLLEMNQLLFYLISFFCFLFYFGSILVLYLMFVQFLFFNLACISWPKLVAKMDSFVRSDCLPVYIQVANSVTFSSIFTVLEQRSVQPFCFALNYWDIFFMTPRSKTTVLWGLPNHFVSYVIKPFLVGVLFPALYLRFVQPNPHRSFESQSQQLNIVTRPHISQADQCGTITFTVLPGCIPGHWLSDSLDGVIDYTDIFSRYRWFRCVWERGVCLWTEIRQI